jgi:DNA-binding transcriptional LysR family regulator
MTVPLHIALLLCGQYKLAWCDIPFELPDHQYYLLWHQKHHKDPEHQWFRDVCFNAISAYLNVDG